MGYQSFPWETGSSQSFEKLLALYLPPLKGKSLLDVGCNTGFFCGFASFQGASKVKGIDKNPQCIELAAGLFPECSFICSDWDNIPKQHFDVILCLSAIHYTMDYQKFIDTIMSRLDKNGVFVLELGIAPGEDTVFVPVERRITAQTSDVRNFPTRSMLEKLLAPYVYKSVGQSVSQAGDPLPRYVYHVMHRKPLAVLLMDNHYSGKSSVVKSALNPDMQRISGDSLYQQILQGSVEVPEELQQYVKVVPGTTRLNCAQITSDICSAGQLDTLLATIVARSHGHNFVLDHYIPEAYRETVCTYMHHAGYFVANLSLYAGQHPGWHMERTNFDNYAAYMKYLERKYCIDEEAYLRANPDVAEAVKAGRFPSGQYHYWRFGRKEKRKLG